MDIGDTGDCDLREMKQTISVMLLHWNQFIVYIGIQIKQYVHITHNTYTIIGATIQRRA